MRRGVTKILTSCMSSFAGARCFSINRGISSSNGLNTRAGISSTPNSISRGAVCPKGGFRFPPSPPLAGGMVGIPPLGVRGARIMGNPNPSRFFNHASATIFASARTRRMYPCRSLTEIAPRASSRLNEWLAFMQ